MISYIYTWHIGMTMEAIYQITYGVYERFVLDAAIKKKRNTMNKKYGRLSKWKPQKKNVMLVLTSESGPKNTGFALVSSSFNFL